MLIGEVSAKTGISARMLRHYDRIGLVSPTGRTHSGYRQYSPSDVHRLFHVEALRSLGLGLQEIVDVLSDLAFDPAPMIEQLIADTRTRIAREQELLQRLERVHTSSPTAWSEVLHTIGLLRGLQASDASARYRLALKLTGETDDVTAVAEAALAEADINVSGALYWALAQHGGKAINILAEAMRSTDPERRHRAVAALEKLDDPRAKEALADELSNPDPLVSGRAALAGAALGDEAVIPALVALIVAGRDDVVAAEWLGGLATDDAIAADIVRAVVDSLSSAPTAERRRLTAALAEIPGPASDKALNDLLGDTDPGVHLTAASVLETRRHGKGYSWPNSALDTD